ncbi:MAG TPA: hypothetical protein VHT72_04975, partial [Puia sp.]|nr:hypothetical protein [Puia sp.]
DLIHAQLQKIFLCPVFEVSDILRHFLAYIIDETLGGRSNTIKEYTIAINVLNKPVSFKPQQDAIVRIHAGRLRRALNYYYRETGMHDEIEISVPKGSYVPVFINKFIRDSNLEKNKISDLQEVQCDSISVAVLPFKTFETDISRQAFADNLGQQLSAEFGRFPDFSVFSYCTAQQLNSRNKDVREIAGYFGAKYMITGNVQFEAKRLRVAVQLMETQSGAQIWTELYDHKYNSSNLFEVGDHIVNSVITVLGDFNGIIVQQMSRGLTKAKPDNVFFTTQSWYNIFYSRFNEEIFIKAFAAMQQSVERNPSDELAWAFLGQLSLMAFLFDQSTPEDPVVYGLKTARTALKINPLSQHGHITLAMAYFFSQKRQAALDELELIIDLNPNATGIMGLCGCIMIAAGEYERGIVLIRRSLSRNKSYPDLFKLFISIYHFKHKEYSLALVCSEEGAMPDFGLSVIIHVAILSHMGRTAQADILIRSLKSHSLNKSWITKEFLKRCLLDEDLVDQIHKGFKSAKFPFLTVA